MTSETAASAPRADAAPDGPTQLSRRGAGFAWGMLPALLVQGTLFVAPLGIMFVYSFWTSRNYEIIPEWTLANYRAFFETWSYPSALFRTLWMSAVIAVVTLLAAYPFTYYIVRYTRRWQKVLIGAVILSFWTSGLLRAYSWMAILGNGGVINKGLRALGIIDEPLPYLVYSPFATVLVMTYFCLPFAVIALYASLEKMDWLLVQAAEDLGASPTLAFWHITLPQTMPGVISASVLTFIPSIGMFFVPLLVGDNSSIMIAPLIANQMQAFQLGLGAALSFIIAIIVMVVLALAWRYVEPRHDQ